MGADETTDSRGILDVGRFRQRVQLRRFAPAPELGHLVRWYWTVRWDLSAGQEHVQAVLSHPGANLSVGPASTLGLDDDRVQATLVGVWTGVDRRRLRGRGWNVAAMLWPGALGAFVREPANGFTDRVTPLGDAVRLDEARLVADVVAGAPDVERQVRTLEGALTAGLAAVDGERLREAEFAARIGRRIAEDRSIRRVDELARATGVGVRTIQRLFREHAGITPLWAIRRYRTIEAVDAAREGRPTSWAQVAADLGYADQAHLTREFVAAVGMTPGEYARSVTP